MYCLSVASMAAIVALRKSLTYVTGGYATVVSTINTFPVDHPDAATRLATRARSALASTAFIARG